MPPRPDVPDPIRSSPPRFAADPDTLRRTAGPVIDRLLASLEASADRRGPVLAPQDPDALLAAWDRPFEPAGEANGDAALADLVDALLQHSNHLHHPGFVGHQVSAPIPAAALVEGVSAALNNGMAVYEMGQLQTIMERRVVEHLGRAIGFAPGAGGVLTHGGSAGNLTALLAARQAMAGFDAWSDGNREPMTVLVSGQAHYCVARSVQIMGWGSQGAWPVATDGTYRLDLADLPAARDRAAAAGRRVIGVVASACSTATGSFDPIDGIADFCREHGLWLHVDGAHGAALALSRRHRGRVAGIERADSVVWDLHKMMGLPALNTAVLFREARRSAEAFAQEAGYLYEPDAGAAPWEDLGPRTLECTKRAMGTTAYAMLRLLGTDWFEAHVDGLMERTAWLAELVAAAPDFEAAHTPEANILCFRHRPAGVEPGADLDAHQRRIRAGVVASGRYYLVQTRLDGAQWLRTTIMNPATTRADLVGLLEALRSA